MLSLSPQTNAATSNCLTPLGACARDWKASCFCTVKPLDASKNSRQRKLETSCFPSFSFWDAFPFVFVGF